MSLFDEAMDDCVMLTKTYQPDGYGGKEETWQESQFTFPAAVVYNTSIEARRAEAEGVKNLYTVTVRKEMNLEYHEVFKRLRDGKIFRVTSDGDDSYTPRSASLNMRQVTAEEWEIPNG